jgi:2-hydroxychromene-2-carboxylate isomerase
MPRRVVRYYFSFPSPFAALADSRIDDLVTRAGGELDPIPVVPPQQPPPPGLAAQLQEFKLSYMLEDTERWARKLGIPWKIPEPRIVDSTDAAAGYYFARARGKERGYRNAVFRARWGEGRNIADREVLAACAERVGLPRAEFVEALDDARCRDEVPKALVRCMEDRIFGVPLFVVDGKRFWGNDRLDFLVEELKRGA